MAFQRNQAIPYQGDATAAISPFQKVMRMFTISVLVSFIGTLVGSMMPQELFAAIFLPLVIAQVVMIIAAFFMARKGKAVGYGFVFSFCFITGLTLYAVIGAYAAAGAGALVNLAFLLTVGIFAGLTAYAYYSKRDFSFLGGFLMVGIIALIVLSLVGMFIPALHSGPLGLIISFAGIMIFSGFILYDVSQYKNGVPEQYMPLAVLSLYLTFINLFLYILQFLGILSDD